MAKFRWSASRLSAYFTCPRAYKFRYKERVKVPKPWYLIFGDGVHRAVGICHKGTGRAPFTPTPERPLYFKSAKKFGGFWPKHWERTVARAQETTGVRWSYSGQFDDLTGLGIQILAGTKDGKHKGYYNSILNPPFPVKILEVEYQIRPTLFGSFDFQATIDQIWETPWGIAIVDLTTGRSQEVKFSQISAYAVAFCEHCREDPKDQVRFGEDGAARFFIWHLRENVLTPRVPEDPYELLEKLEYAAANIQDGYFPKTADDSPCRFCEFREICGRKVVGKAIPAFNGEIAEIQIPPASKPPKAKQRYFRKGAEGGWFRGKQVKGKG